jgi:hypothetical protein
MPAPEQDSDHTLGWIIAGVVGFAVIASVVGSGKDGPAAEPLTRSDYEAVDANVATPAAAETPLPLDKGAVKRGQTQMKLVAGLDLSGAAKIFSQNCYDALSRKFDWHQLDRCGGFDAAARRWTDGLPTLAIDEADWFQSEAAATRYLSAATSNGLPPSEADIRWEAIGLASSTVSFPSELVVQDDDAVVAPNDENSVDVSSIPPENGELSNRLD